MRNSNSGRPSRAEPHIFMLDASLGYKLEGSALNPLLYLLSGLNFYAERGHDKRGY